MNEKIKELRKTLGLTMEKFGERLAVKKNTVSQWESGTNALTDQMFKAICNVNWDGRYVNEEWLRGNSEEMFKKDSGSELDALAQKYQMSNTEYVFMKEFFKLEPSHREDFFKTLDKVFSAIHAENFPQTVPDGERKEKSIDEKVEEYRLHLELEEKAAAKSEVS